MNTKFNIQNNFIPDEQKILPSELKDAEFKIGQITFIPDEHKILQYEIILFLMNKKFYHPN